MMTEIYLKPLINSMKHCLCSWKKWNLSLIGKIAVLKMFAFPKIVYHLTVLQNPPKAYINTIQSIFYDFLWNSKPDKIARNTRLSRRWTGRY